MPKSFTKVWLPGFILLLITGVIAVNSFFYFSKDKIARELSRELRHEVLIDKIFYIFPDEIALQGVALQDIPRPGSPPTRIFSIPKFVLKFSIWDLVVRHHFSAKAITIDSPDVRYRQLVGFLQVNITKILRILDQVPVNDIKLKMKNIAVNFGRDKNADAHADFTLSIRDKKVVAAGALRQAGDPAHPLQARLRGEIKPGEGFFFSDLFFERYDFSGKFWGNFSTGRLQINGYSLWDTLAKPEGWKNPLTASQRLKSLLRWQADRRKRLDPNVYILDIGCRTRGGYPKSEIEAFVFSVNGMPVSIKGDISWENPVTMALTATLLPSQEASKPMRNFERTDITLLAVMLNNALNTSGHADVRFRNSPDDMMPFENIHINFENAIISSTPALLLKLYLEKAEVAYQINGNTHALKLADSTAALSAPANRLKVITVKSPFYEGNLDGKIWLDASHLPLRMTADVLLSDVNANRLDTLVDHFAKIHGRLFSRMYFTNDPDFALTGSISIQNGQLKEFEFFKWLAENFALDSLMNVEFKNASADFILNTQKTGLDHVDLSSDDVKVKGSFFADRDSLVTSKLSLVFSRDLLETSPKFRPVLNRFEDLQSFGLDFQLSGRQEAMNFHWLDSEIKQKIQAWIPNFIERKIERNIDKGLEKAEPETTPAPESEPQSQLRIEPLPADEPIDNFNAK